MRTEIKNDDYTPNVSRLGYTLHRLRRRYHAHTPREPRLQIRCSDCEAGCCQRRRRSQPPRKTMFPSLAKKPDGPATGFPALPTQNRSCTRKPASRQNDIKSDLPNVRTIRNVRKRTEQKNRLPERFFRSGSSNNFFTKQNQTLRCPS